MNIYIYIHIIEEENKILYLIEEKYKDISKLNMI